MKTMENLIGEHTYLVIDHESNRFIFSGLIEVTPELVQESTNVAEWSLTEDLPESVRRAIDVMAENDVEMNDFTGVIRFERDADTYYVLFIKQ